MSHGPNQRDLLLLHLIRIKAVKEVEKVAAREAATANDMNAMQRIHWKSIHGCHHMAVIQF